MLLNVNQIPPAEILQRGPEYENISLCEADKNRNYRKPNRPVLRTYLPSMVNISRLHLRSCTPEPPGAGKTNILGQIAHDGKSAIPGQRL
jgi:hypothetical protein